MYFGIISHMYCLSSHRKLITILYILHNINDNIKDGNWAMIFVGLCFHYLILVLWLYDEHACINCNWVTVGTFKWMNFSAKWKLNGYLDVFGDACCHIIRSGPHVKSALDRTVRLSPPHVPIMQLLHVRFTAYSPSVVFTFLWFQVLAP